MNRDRSEKLRMAIYSRAFGAGELILACSLGEYPPDHAAIDARLEELLIETTLHRSSPRHPAQLLPGRQGRRGS